MSPLPMDPKTLNQLGAIAGMLGSDHAGERSAAAYQATKLLRRHGLTWREIIERALRDVEDDEPPLSWRDQVDECLGRHWRLTNWEHAFVCELAGYQRTPSDKQLAILDRLYRKIQAR